MLNEAIARWTTRTESVAAPIRKQRRALDAACLLACLGALWLGLSPGRAGAAEAPYAPALHGTVVRFGLHGFEPDFDPIYGMVLAITLHDTRPAPLALPDATLVLDLYLESFQPDTTPILPDLLHPNQTASNLAGFLQGQAALVNRGGHIAYRGDVLAEVFADSTVHLILLHMQRPGAPASAAELRLQGVMTLHKGGTQTGQLQALTPLARAALAVPRGRALSWQQVVAGLSVQPPRMVGTAGGQPPRGTPAPPNNPLAVATVAARPATARATHRLSVVSIIAIACGVALLLLTGLLLWRRPRRGQPRQVERP